MSDAYRQSALLLHGLNDIDRQWLLDQLDAEHHGQLRSHLTELNQMGMVQNRSLAEGLLARIRPKAGDPVQRTGNVLRRADSKVVLHLLANEPAWLIAAVLSIEAWPWREAIYVGLDVSKRDRVKHALRQNLPVKLGAELIAQLEHKLPEAILATGRSPGNAHQAAGWLRALRNRIGL